MSEIAGWDPTVVVPDCPKCGSDKGWDWPKYYSDGTYEIRRGGPAIVVNQHESLDYTCKTCGYIRREPTKDAKP